MSSPYVMRPAQLSDFDALRSMAVESGAGFTSLPVDEDILRSKLLRSVDSFAGRLDQPEYGKYLLMLENTETGEIGGCSAVKAGVGVKSPFFFSGLRVHLPFCHLSSINVYLCMEKSCL